MHRHSAVLALHVGQCQFLHVGMVLGDIRALPCRAVEIGRDASVDDLQVVVRLCVVQPELCETLTGQWYEMITQQGSDRYPFPVQPYDPGA